MVWPEWDSLMERLASGKEWIIDGNYGRTMDIRLQEADTVIFLDYPAYLNLLRVLKRREPVRTWVKADLKRLTGSFLNGFLLLQRQKAGNIKEIDKTRSQDAGTYLYQTESVKKISRVSLVRSLFVKR